MKNKILFICGFIYFTPHLSFGSNDECAKEGMSAGGSTPAVLQCCPGLIETNSWTHSHLKEGCNIPPPPGSDGYCVKCGDSKCDSKNFENKCNCPKDCK